jgi:hypothetical protein
MLNCRVDRTSSKELLTAHRFHFTSTITRLLIFDLSIDPGPLTDESARRWTNPPAIAVHELHSHDSEQWQPCLRPRAVQAQVALDQGHHLRAAGEVFEVPVDLTSLEDAVGALHRLPRPLVPKDYYKDFKPAT